MNNDNILSCYKIRVNGLTPTGDGNQTLEIFQDHILHVLMALPQQGTETPFHFLLAIVVSSNPC